MIWAYLRPLFCEKTTTHGLAWLKEVFSCGVHLDDLTDGGTVMVRRFWRAEVETVGVKMRLARTKSSNLSVRRWFLVPP